MTQTKLPPKNPARFTVLGLEMADDGFDGGASLYLVTGGSGRRSRL